VADCRELEKRGLPANQLVVYLHKLGVSITESMKIVMEVYEIPLADAKHLVSAHPVWKDVVSAAAPLHNELEQELQEAKEK
jgi:hypothetical protein